MTLGGKHERCTANPALRPATRLAADAAAVVTKAGARERHGRHDAPRAA